MKPLLFSLGFFITSLTAAGETRTSRETFNSQVREALYQGLDATSAQGIDAPQATLHGLRDEAKRLDDAEGLHNSTCSKALEASEEILTDCQNAFRNTFVQDRSRPIPQLLSKTHFWSTAFVDIAPRSEFIGKVLAAVERISPIDHHDGSPDSLELKIWRLTTGIKTLDDASSVLAQIDVLRADQQGLQDTLSSEQFGVKFLRTIVKTYQSLQSGAPARSHDLADIIRPYYPQKNPGVRQAQRLFLSFAISRLVDAPPDLLPEKKEDPADYVRRVLTKAGSLRNWTLCSKVLETVHALQFDEVATISDTANFGHFMAAVDADQNNHRSKAVHLYRSVMQTKSEFIPVDYIAERLDAIQKESPQEYVSGMNMILSDPSGRPFPYHPGPQPFRPDPIRPRGPQHPMMPPPKANDLPPPPTGSK